MKRSRSSEEQIDYRRSQIPLRRDGTHMNRKKAAADLCRGAAACSSPWPTQVCAGDASAHGRAASGQPALFATLPAMLWPMDEVPHSGDLDDFSRKCLCLVGRHIALRTARARELVARGQPECLLRSGARFALEARARRPTGAKGGGVGWEVLHRVYQRPGSAEDDAGSTRPFFKAKAVNAAVE
jgi:hypothetical protein